MTIENNIPKETNKYELTMDDYALVDSNIANSQLDIGQSSNLAQLCLTYSYNFDDKKFDDYVCILSVLAQVSELYAHIKATQNGGSHENDNPVGKTPIGESRNDHSYIGNYRRTLLPIMVMV